MQELGALASAGKATLPPMPTGGFYAGPWGAARGQPGLGSGCQAAQKRSPELVLCRGCVAYPWWPPPPSTALHAAPPGPRPASDGG